MIEIHSIDKEVPNVDSELFVLGLERLVLNESKMVDAINVICVSDAYLLKMNIEHLSHDYYTDIITFDYCDGDAVSGDLFISIDRVVENAVAHSVSPELEFIRVAIHGVLHLCGYKDKSDEESLLMRSKEDYYLSFCGFT
jgi:probable rRNA maturation factor